MARNDGLAMGWVPPIEPPGVVIVTANSLQPQPSAASERLTDQDPVAGLKGENEALRSALEQWSQAWRQQDMGLYLAAYADDFEPANGMDRQAWAKWRTARILSKQHIRHDMQDVTVQMDGGKALVQFTQVYRDERAQLTDHKTMHWVKCEGRWLITREMTD
jgi:ketosteroid isomerase-like protein